MYNTKVTLRKIENFFLRNKLKIQNKDLVFTRCFNEAWFSNTLSWLLDPKGSHGLRAEFANEFLKKIAQIRTKGAKQNKYKRKNSLFKWGKKGHGRPTSNLSLKNAAVAREFYLSKSIKRGVGKKPRFCDVAFFDLDSSDSIFVAIENKLFSSNHPFQLEDYYDLIEDRFRRAKTREYVYLTIHGFDPVKFKGETSRKDKYWIRMSWIDDIYTLLNIFKGKTENREVAKLTDLLGWLRKLCNKNIKEHIENLRSNLLQATATCLQAELNRLGTGKPGSWKLPKQHRQNVTIIHTSHPKTPLHLDMLPNLSITLQSRRNGKPLFEKIIVPYGTNTDQIYNLLDIAARDVYHYHFNGNRNRYLADKRRLTECRTTEKIENENIFNFVSKYRNELLILFTMSQAIWMAQKNDLQESHIR